MANAVRPPLRSSIERRTRLTLSPVALDDAHRNHNHTTVPSRRNEQPVKQLNHTPAKAAHPVRTASRKRPAAALSPDATDTRPPTKVTVTQPHGELLRITNGVTATLGIDEDDVSSARSTPRPGLPASGAASTSQDKRSLRSHDGGSRLKSHLAIYFSNYDDIIVGLPKPSGTFHADTALAVA